MPLFNPDVVQDTAPISISPMDVNSSPHISVKLPPVLVMLKAILPPALK